MIIKYKIMEDTEAEDEMIAADLEEGFAEESLDAPEEPPRKLCKLDMREAT